MCVCIWKFSRPSKTIDLFHVCFHPPSSHTLPRPIQAVDLLRFCFRASLVSHASSTLWKDRFLLIFVYCFWYMVRFLRIICVLQYSLMFCKIYFFNNCDIFNPSSNIIFLFSTQYWIRPWTISIVCKIKRHYIFITMYLYFNFLLKIE